MSKESPIDNHLRRLRFDRGEMSQEALARAVGITRQTVIALESLRYAPSLELAMKIADVFGKRVDEVFFWRNQPGGSGASSTPSGAAENSKHRILPE